MVAVQEEGGRARKLPRGEDQPDRADTAEKAAKFARLAAAEAAVSHLKIRSDQRA